MPRPSGSGCRSSWQGLPPLALLLVLAACTRERAPFVGSARCGTCHGAALESWRGSLHARAAGPARPGGVQAPFDGRELQFASLAGRPVADGDGLAWAPPDGGSAPVPLPLVLGAAQIEQFLAEGPGGRFQALPVGFDPTAAEWFDIVPEAPAPGAWEHWRNPGMTANSQCLVCHVTGFAAGYDPDSDTYASRWSELGVGCEACHGAGAAHVAAREHGTADRGYGAVATAHEAMASCAPCHARASRSPRRTRRALTSSTTSTSRRSIARCITPTASSGARPTSGRPSP